MRIAVRGWSGKHNIGDDAYRIAIPHFLPLHCVEFWEACDMRDPGKTDPDLFLLGGGDVVYHAFTDDFKHRPNTRRIVASVTLTPASDFAFLRTCEKIFVRDMRSLKVAADHGVTATYLPDFAFVLRPNVGAGRAMVARMFAREGRELYDKLVVVVGSAYLMNNDLDALARDHTTFQYVTQELARTFDQANASFLFVPFGTAYNCDDRACNAYIDSRCKFRRKNLVVYDRMSVQGALDVIATADVVISSRLHSSIFATIGGALFLNISHHDKGRGYMELLHREVDDFSFWDFESGTFRLALDNYLNHVATPSRDLIQFTKGARGLLNETSIL